MDLESSASNTPALDSKSSPQRLETTTAELAGRLKPCCMDETANRMMPHTGSTMSASVGCHRPCVRSTVHHSRADGSMLGIGR